MERVSPNAREIEEFLVNEVLHGVDLEPQESQSLLTYMQERHEHLFGPFTTYFVLGSYEKPFKFRLEVALSELNSRLHAYAYLLAPQPDPVLSDRIPVLKLKFYVHALYADWIALVLEHNTGGALVEFGRVDRPFLLDRTYVLPRGYERHLDEPVGSMDELHARSIELAYEVGEETALRDGLTTLVEEATAIGISVSVDDLTTYLATEFGGRLLPSYSGVITDGLRHYERTGRCLPWTTEDDLRTSVSRLP